MILIMPKASLPTEDRLKAQVKDWSASQSPFYYTKGASSGNSSNFRFAIPDGEDL
jgi:hypothetical protein